MTDGATSEATAFPFRRPVYVLGAGFSRAISQMMPLTDELGDAITSMLGVRWPVGTEAMSFEDRLTLLSTPLPFLEGYANTERRALAEKVTAALATELSTRNEQAAQTTAPLWLLQLVSLWHAEQAIVLTFNYDTLVEQAVTELCPPVHARGGIEPSGIHGWQVVFPAPTPVNSLTYESLGGPLRDSFQLLKLHGSLNWYWALGDGATVVRDATVLGFGPRMDVEDSDVAGVRLLDQFLVPPVTSKDSYYGVNLVHTVWRAANAAIRNAASVAVIGYSMPPGDRIAAELLRSVPEGTPVDVVNWSVGTTDEPTSPLGRASSLGLTIGETWEGEQAVSEFTAARLALASTQLSKSPAFASSDASVVVSLPPQGVGHRSPRAYTVRNGANGIAGVADLDWQQASTSNMPPTEFSLQHLPAGLATYSDFYTAGSLFDATRDGGPFRILLNDHVYRVVGANASKVGRWPALQIWTAPE
jgi:hypothetical protein